MRLGYRGIIIEGTVSVWKASASYSKTFPSSPYNHTVYRTGCRAKGSLPKITGLLVLAGLNFQVCNILFEAKESCRKYSMKVR